MRKQSINIHNKKKKIFIGSCAAILALSAAFVVQSPMKASADYTREVTPQMQINGTDGVPDDDGETSDTSNRVTIGNSILYDSDSESYLYKVGTGYIYSNVLDKMIIQDIVTVTADEGISISVYRNGDLVELSDDNTIEEAGSYTVMSGKKGNETEVFSFIIAGESIKEPDTYNLPTTCVTSSVTLDDEKVKSDNRSVDLSEEGHYVIDYRCVRNGLSYTLDVTVDHTAPKLTLDGLKKNKARGKVTIKGLEDGATLTVTKDGKTIKASSELTQPGSYTVRVTDAAGNSTMYSFYILFYLNAGGITLTILAVTGILAVIVYLYISRKRMRVR